MKLIIAFSLFCLVVSSNLYSQNLIEYETSEEAWAQLRKMFPKESAFVFQKPKEWKTISLSSAEVILLDDLENPNEAAKIIDGETNTSWKTNNYYKKPEVVIDLGSIKKFNEIVIYNRTTSARGTGGGNNALKTVGISYSNNLKSLYKPLGKFELTGPKAVCVKVKGGHQICTFIDNTEPNILEISTIEARYLKLNFINAFWGNKIPKEWRDSFSLTELSLFKK